MAQFRAIIQGNRNSVSRLGGKNSGIIADVNGWNLGVTVIGHLDQNGQDVFDIYRTGGSNNPSRGKVILTVKNFNPLTNKVQR